MTTVTWAQLTPGQQAYLDDRARYGGKWEIVSNSFYVSGIKPEDHRQLLHDFHFIEMVDDLDDLRFVHERITPAGIAVWQQGQAASTPPRSVWVAEKGADEDRDILSVHTTEAGAKAACQRDWERHIETRSHLNYPKTITWKQFDWGGDGSGYYSSQSGPYYVGQYPLVDDAE